MNGKQAYVTYSPTIAISSLQYTHELGPFPSVTLCDTNPYKQSEVEKIPRLAKLVNDSGLHAHERLQLGIAAMNSKDRALLSTQTTDFIKQCSFNGQACMIGSEFEYMPTVEHGNCFTFNTRGEKQGGYMGKGEVGMIALYK